MSDQQNGSNPAEPGDDPVSQPDQPDVGADTVPPVEAAPLEPAAVESSGWSSGAKTTVAVLAVLAVLGAIGTIVGFSQASDSDDDVSTAEVERDAEAARADTAEDELETVSSQLEEAEAAGEAVTAERDEAAVERDEALAANEALAADVETEAARADAAEAQLEEIGEQFPVTVDTSLVGLDVAGTYSVSFTEAYCDFATGCGTLPASDSATIGVTPENFLDITVDGILQAGLFAVNGGLYGITDSETAIPPCGDTPRRGRVTITIFPAGITVAEDGTRTVDLLEASITLDAPTIGECPSGLVFWGAVLTPVG